MKAIERDFPFEQIDEIAEMESYRKEINRPIYHIHKWWAKRLGSVFRAITMGAIEEDWKDFYEHSPQTTKVVLDPFMGSGTTVGESIKLGYRSIGCDINPVSTFLVKQALTRVELVSLKKVFAEIEKDTANDLKQYYKTLIPGHQTPCDVLYYFWVKVVVSPDGEEIPLFNNYIFSKNAYPSKKPISQVVCPTCNNIFTCLYNSTSEQCSECLITFDPQKGPVKGSKVCNSKGEEFKIKDLIKESGKPPVHKLFALMALTPSGKKVYLKPKEFDFELYKLSGERFKELEPSLPLPNMAVRQGHNTDQARGYNYLWWRDFFNPRQLLVLGLLYKRVLAVENKEIREQLISLFSSTLEFNNMFCSFKGEGTGAVRHMFSNHILKPEKTPLENNVWGTQKSSGSFSTLFKSKLLKAKQYLDAPFEISIRKINGVRTTEKVVCSPPINVKVATDWQTFANSDVLLLNGDSGKLPIPDGSVDAVITDPPYFDFIHYSELSDFFYAWLSLGLNKHYEYFQKEDSSNVNEVQDKDAETFSTKIGRIFSECNRVLKNEGLLCFSYHHSTIDGWMAIYKAIANANLTIVAAHPVKAEMDVASPKTSAKNPINLDSILICKKDFKHIGNTNIKDDIFTKYYYYLSRFDTVNRKLSNGDKFVILCSQTLVQSSIRSLTISDANKIIREVVAELNIQVEEELLNLAQL